MQQVARIKANGTPDWLRSVDLTEVIDRNARMSDCRFSPGKYDFFKVCDIDTTIQPREKEGQTDVSSALKTFYDHYRGF